MLNEFKKKTLKLKEEIKGLSAELSSYIDKFKKTKKDAENLSLGLKKYEKTDPAIFSQMKNLLDSKKGDLLAIKKNVENITARQSQIKFELKDLFEKANTWEKKVKDSRKNISNVLSGNLDIKKEAPKSLKASIKKIDQKIESQFNAKPAKKAEPPLKLEEKAVVESESKKVKEPSKPSILKGNKETIQSKAAKESDAQDKYLLEMSKKHRNYGAA